jgi:GAF domain-containing protein/HAMP domain-containing protein
VVTILVSGIASATLDSRWSTRATIAAIGIGITVTLTDQFTPIGFGTPTDPRFTVPFSILLSAVYAIFLGARYQSFSLRTKLIIAFVIVSVVPLAVLGYQSYRNIYNLLTVQTNTNLLSTASLTADSVDSFIQTQLDTIRTQSQVIDLAEYLQISSTQRQGSVQENRAIKILQAFKRADPIYISSYCLLDKDGIDILDTYIDDIGIYKGNRTYFTEPFIKGTPFVSPVQYSTSTAERSLYFSSPIRNNYREIIGVLRVRFNAGILQEILNNSLKTTQTSRYAVLVDSQFSILLAHTNDPGLIFTSYGELTPTLVRELQNEGRMAPGVYSTVVNSSSAYVDAVNNLDKNPIFTTSESTSNGENLVSAGVGLKNVPGWVVLIREPETASLGPITNQTRASTLLSLLMAAFAVGAAALVAQFLSTPITQLTNVAQKVSAGNLDVQAVATANDEIGLLAKTFNSMTAQLRQTLTGLEQRVSERTAELETAQQLTEKRAQELETISQVSRVIASEQNIDILLPLITRLISERFNYYHTGIFLLDDMQVYAVLRASNSTGGQRMLARGHKLEIGLKGLVSFVAQKGQPRIALDVDDDVAFLSNPDLPDTRSEIALPLNLRGKTIGVLDVQSTQSAAFTDMDANTLSTLAEQVAIAIDNARLFRETQRALAESQALYRQFISQTWEKPLGQDTKIGYLQSFAGGSSLKQPISSPEIKQAIAKGEMILASTNNKKQVGNLPDIAIPIKLREQVIGVMTVRSSEQNRTWNQDELALVRAVSERVAFALENARLLDESQRRAAKERVIGQISSKISAAVNTENILKTAVGELGSIIPNTEITIQFVSGNEQTK